MPRLGTYEVGPPTLPLLRRLELLPRVSLAAFRLVLREQSREPVLRDLGRGGRDGRARGHLHGLAALRPLGGLKVCRESWEEPSERLLGCGVVRGAEALPEAQ